MKPTGARSSDEELILRYYASRDDFAFEELVHRYSSKLYGVFVRRRVPDSDIPDRVNETWLRVARTIEPGKIRYDPATARFATYLYSIAVNLVMDHVRGLRNRPETRESELLLDNGAAKDDSYFDRIEAADPDPEVEFDAEEARTQLLQCIAKLPESHVLIIHFLADDLTYAQIGEILKMPLQTVVSRHRSAINRLRVCLTGQTNNPQQL
jgi:RNA polymerase sigma-70 factor (ECF subfamily)